MVGRTLSLYTNPDPVITGTPCNSDGYNLQPGVPLQDHDSGLQPDWSPFALQAQFETTNFLFRKVKMSQADINTLMQLWASTTADGCVPFQNHQEMLEMIDAIDISDIPWQSFSVKYSGAIPPANLPDWMLHEYTVFFRDLLCHTKHDL